MDVKKINEELLQRIIELENSVANLSKEKEKYKALADAKKLNNVADEYKDRLFKFIFGNPDNKAWTLSLYNAINGTGYTDPEDITFNTIDDAVYMHMKNDISFIVSSVMNLWEHQSTVNPNMPMRFFIYGGMLYDKYTATSSYYKYSSKLQKVPIPKCICFYNGTAEQPESSTLKLSDAYMGEGDIEVKVTMLNINYGKNQKLMEACKPLEEYAWLVDSVRKNQKDKMDLELAVDMTIDKMQDSFMIKQFLVGNRAEVKQMFLTEYDQEKVMEQERKEIRIEVATDMLKKKFSLDDIIDISKLSKETILSIADSLGISVT